MGDTNRPVPGTEDQHLVEVPKAKNLEESGKHPVSPGNADERMADVVAAISGITNDSVNQVADAVDNVIAVDFGQLRRKGLRGSHVTPKKNASGSASPKGLAKPKLPKPRLVKPAPARPKPSRPKPPKVDGLTPIPTPMVKKIAGGKRTEVSTAALEAETDYAKRTSRERLLQIAGILGEQLMDRDAKPCTGVEVAAAARELLALSANEELIYLKRSTDNTYFNAVATILLSLWPRNFQRYLDDRRVTDMMRVIRDGGPHARILGLIKNWLDHPIS